MLIKYESGAFKLLDSLYNLNHSTFKIMVEIYGNDKVVWEISILILRGSFRFSENLLIIILVQELF